MNTTTNIVRVMASAPAATLLANYGKLYSPSGFFFPQANEEGEIDVTGMVRTASLASWVEEMIESFGFNHRQSIYWVRLVESTRA